METRRHWIQFTNTLTTAEKTRIRRTITAIESNEKPLPFTPQVSMEGGGGQEALRAGAERRRSRTPPCRATSFRAFYRVYPDGRKQSSARYCVYAGGPLGLAEELLMKLCDGRVLRSGASVPRSVQEAVAEAVQQGVVSSRRGEAYLKKYRQYQGNTHILTVHLREQGKNAVREYQGGYRMLKHPSIADVARGHVRRFTVHHVATFRP